MSFVAELPVTTEGSTVLVHRAGVTLRPGDLVTVVFYGGVGFNAAHLSDPWVELDRWPARGRWRAGQYQNDVAGDEDILVARIVTDTTFEQDVITEAFMAPYNLASSQVIVQRPPSFDGAWLWRGEKSVPEVASLDTLVRDPESVGELRTSLYASLPEVRMVGAVRAQAQAHWTGKPVYWSPWAAQKSYGHIIPWGTGGQEEAWRWTAADGSSVLGGRLGTDKYLQPGAGRDAENVVGAAVVLNALSEEWSSRDDDFREGLIEPGTPMYVNQSLQVEPTASKTRVVPAGASPKAWDTATSWKDYIARYQVQGDGFTLPDGTTQTGTLFASGMTQWLEYIAGAVWRMQRVFAVSTAAPGPARPALLDPADGGGVDAALPWSVTWRYMPGLGGACTAAQVRRRKTGTTTDEYWDAAAGVWGLNESSVSVSGAATTAQITQPETNGASYQLWVRTRGTAPNTWSQWSTPVSIVTAPGGVASLFIVDLDPATSVLTWPRAVGVVTGQAPGGETIASWDAQLVDAGGVVQEDTSGIIGAAWYPQTNLTDGSAWTARARVVTGKGVTSAWTAVAFTVELGSPVAPAVSVAPSADDVSGLPGMLVSASFPVSPGDQLAPLPMRVRTQRRGPSSPDAPWVTVGVSHYEVGATTWELLDVGADPGWWEWRQRGEWRHAETGVIFPGPWGVTQGTAPPPAAGGGWVFDPRDPSTAVRVIMSADDQREHDHRSKATATLNGQWQVSSQGTLAERGEFVALVEAEEDRAPLVELLTSHRVLVALWCGDIRPDGGRGRPHRVWHRPVDSPVVVERRARGRALRGVSWSWVGVDALEYVEDAGDGLGV